MLSTVRRVTGILAVFAVVVGLIVILGNASLSQNVAAESSSLLATPSVRVSPSSKIVRSGEQFAVDVWIDNASDLGAYEFDFVYDPAVVEVISPSVAEGGFLDNTGREIGTLPTTGPAPDNETGKVPYGAYSYVSSGETISGPNGSGRLARVWMRAKAAGTAALSLENVLATDTQANVTLDQSSVSVGSIQSKEQTIDSVALYDPSVGRFYLRSSNEVGPASVTAFRYGPKSSTWIPLAGDWDGDGIDTVALYDPAAGRFYLRSSTGSVTAFRYGPKNSAWTPLVSDWDGSDGIDTVALYDPVVGRFYLRSSNEVGPASVTAFRYGPRNSTWTPLASDWEGN